ncbi:MAG: hypothetical protein QF689_00680 [Candidatus Latescibacteria bacterium]|nr:hypothetical protein [Candidatus Latescibacterota bacterium]MDP7447075.1 hypothetical protein [Candidatus Latescibacterota bacterium]HJP34266.1 hypothetical protein [Candidatus Latescibacterota bacterium]
MGIHAAWVLSIAVLASCWPGSRRAAGPGIEAQLQQVLQGWQTQDTITVAGIRLIDGKTSPETMALDESLLSAAVRAGVPVRPDAGVAGSARAIDVDWKADDLLPRDWRQLPGDMVAAGQLRPAPPWVYLRLALADGATGLMRDESVVRVSERDLTRLTEARQARLSGSAVAALVDLDLEFHLLVRRNEGGFPRLVEWEEGGQLEEGDRLQLRFRSGQDCEVFAFLFRSEGETTVLHDGTVFANRWVYAPGENAWEGLSQGDEVYTLYLLAARRLEEDKSSMWEELARLQTQGQVEKFRGLELIDAEVMALLQRTVEVDSVSLQRGRDDIETGETERFVYSDGTAFDNDGDLLSGRFIARAYSMEVQFR